MRDGHSEYSKLVRLASQGTARGYHVAQLVDISRHFIAPTSLYLTMTFPAIGALSIIIILLNLFVFRGQRFNGE